MTPATKIIRRLLLLPVKEAEARDAAVTVEVQKFKEEARKSRMISGWIDGNSKKLRELHDELLGKLE